MNGVSRLYSGMNSLLPVVGMLMIMVGAVVYAAGQIMGAETRARANVWATSALTGALVAMLIAAISPGVLQTMYPGMNTDCSFACAGKNPTQQVLPGGSCCVLTNGHQLACPPATPNCGDLTGVVVTCQP